VAKRWDKNEENKLRNELVKLYEVKNKTIEEISKILDIGQSTVCQRMNRLGIKSNPETKKNYLNRRTDVYLPTKYNEDIANFLALCLAMVTLAIFKQLFLWVIKKKATPNT